MQVVPYLYFNGQAAEALTFYETALKAKASSAMTYKEQPYPGMPEAYGDMILHAELVAGGNVFYVSDAACDHAVQTGDNVQINLNCESEEELRWIYDHLSEGGQIRMALQDTFWGALFGSLTDRYNITWSLNYQKNM